MLVLMVTVLKRLPKQMNLFLLNVVKKNHQMKKVMKNNTGRRSRKKFKRKKLFLRVIIVK